MSADPSLEPVNGVRALVETVEQVVHGRRAAVGLAVAAIVSGGHVLIEDTPGSGKTTLARALAHALGGSFRRIQGTADLMPSDITGSAIWEPASRQFSFVPGPVFANVVLVDELNRTPPRTQSALLEAMDEGAVTVDGIRHTLPEPFVLLATQNPFEQWGTYPLPEGQLDRFTAMIHLGANATDTERLIVREQLAGPTVDGLEPIMTAEDLVGLRTAARHLHVAESIIGYAVAIAEGTRNHPEVSIGASTRATIALVRCAQAATLLNGRPHVIPEDVRNLAVPVLAHRLILAGNADRRASVRIVEQVVAQTPAPLSGA